MEKNPSSGWAVQLFQYSTWWHCFSITEIWRYDNEDDTSFLMCFDVLLSGYHEPLWMAQGELCYQPFWAINRPLINHAWHSTQAYRYPAAYYKLVHAKSLLAIPISFLCRTERWQPRWRWRRWGRRSAPRAPRRCWPLGQWRRQIASTRRITRTTISGSQRASTWPTSRRNSRGYVRMKH